MMNKTRYQRVIYVLAALLLVFSPLWGCAKRAVSAPGTNVDHELTAEKKMVAETPSSVETSGAAPVSAVTSSEGAVASTAAEPVKTSKGAEAIAGAYGAAARIRVPSLYLVKKGDCLWSVAKKKEIYADPYLWPIIYEANGEIIKNPNLIYPGQKLNIPRDGYTMEAIKQARKNSGAKKPYTPPQTAKPPMN